MTRRLRTAVIAAALALSALLAGAGTAGAAVPSGFVGAVVDGPLYPATGRGVDLGAQFAAMTASGVQSVKVVFDWAEAQPYPTMAKVPARLRSQFTDVGGVPTRFGEIDRIVGLAAARGMTVLPTVIYAPSWDAIPEPGRSLAIPRDTAPYAAFLSALVGRYGPRGSFWRGAARIVPVRQWEIWNEPNVTHFWTPQPFEPSYLPLVHAAHDAIKGADPTALVVLGGLPNFSWKDLQAVYGVPGASAWFDAVAAHPYTRDPAGVITILQRVRAVMNAHGDRRKPMIADEIGWPSAVGYTRRAAEYDFDTTPAGQASRIAQILPLLGRERTSLGLLGFDLYTWLSDERRNQDSFAYAGLSRYLRGRITAKPALAAFTSAALALEGCRSKGALATTCRH